jgi:hypothetical protein
MSQKLYLQVEESNHHEQQKIIPQIVSHISALAH